MNLFGLCEAPPIKKPSMLLISFKSLIFWGLTEPPYKTFGDLSLNLLLILLQKSEGGALGIGVSQDNFMFSRTAGNFMTKATAVVATFFIICSLGLTIISRGELTPTTSVLDKIEEKSDDTPKIPENNN